MNIYNGREDVEKIKRMIDIAVESNYNAIRLWGGGQYESDEFYDYCFQKGLLIVHDFMFANGMYLYDDKYKPIINLELTQ